MDGGREHDLQEMHEVFSNTSISMSEREQAYRAYCEIQRQVKDKKLSSLRERVIKAIRVRDHTEMRKLNEQILEHKHRMQYGR